MSRSQDETHRTVGSPWVVVLVGVLVVTAGCAGFGDDPASTSTTTVTPAPAADNPGSLAGTTTTADTVTGDLPYRFEVSNDLERNVTITVTYAANGTTTVSKEYGPGTNVSLGAELRPPLGYVVTISTGDHDLWTETIESGEGYRVAVTEWGRVTVESHVTTG